MAREFVESTAVVRPKLKKYSKIAYSNNVAGKSDPFVVFTLNDQKVFKSQTKKKTLTPEWNEQFAVQVVRFSHRLCLH